jgi:uncharacterized protein YkwD
MSGRSLAARARAAGGGLLIALLGIWVVLGGLVGLAPGATGTPKAGTASRRHLAKVERRLRECTNAARLKNGLKPLRARMVLHLAARMHAYHMARFHFLDHVDQQGREPWDRIAMFHPREHYVAMGENIAGGQATARSACSALLHSPEHRDNMLGPYNRIGAGFWHGGPYRRYYVLEFARTQR